MNNTLCSIKIIYEALINLLHLIKAYQINHPILFIYIIIDKLKSFF